MATDLSAASISRPLDACLAQISRISALRSTLMDSLPPVDPSRLPVDRALLAPLLDAVALFDALNISYALIGGLAAMVYGRPRATDDVDFAISADQQEVLARHPADMRTHHFDPASAWKLYHDTGVEIDLWKDEYSGEIAARAKTVQLGDRTVRIADVHDLVAMKLRANRIQDDYDISEILKNASLDESLIRQRVTPSQFDHYLEVKARTARQ